MQNYDLSLYLVTDRGYLNKLTLAELVEEAIAGGVTAIQLREKKCSTREFIEQAQQINKIVQDKNIPLIINDRIDIALAINAAGVHLGQNDMPVKIARKILGRDSIIGFSVENMAQLEEAQNMDVDYLGLSPLFTTQTKPELKKEWGIEGLKMASNKSSHKIVAIGRIDDNNAAKVIKSGADGIAVVSAICADQNPREAAAKLLKEIQNARENK